MASLRKRQVDTVVATADTAQPVNVSIDSNAPPAPPPTPAPEPLTPPSDASGALKRQLEALQQSETVARQRDALLTAEGRRREWLANTPIAQRHYDHLGAFHNEALQAGLADTSPDYFQHMESRLAGLHSQQHATVGAHLIDEMQARTAQERTPPPAPERPRTNIVSAPVSREVPTASGNRENGKITLSPAQRDAARISGVSDAEYGRQLLRLNGMKASGEYSDRR